MPITEFATLQLTSPYTLSSPPLQELFETLSTRQAAWSKHPLYFFVDALDSSIIYLITGWDDVPPHWRWIESDENQELVKAFAPTYLTVKGLLHLEIDFTVIPKEVALVVAERVVTHEEIKESPPDASWVAAGRDLEEGSSTLYIFSEKMGEVMGSEIGGKERSDAIVMRRIWSFR
ncbi:hypothetical protein Hypma_010715 [Hypsizygus marmoreus]|uniref:ABM domain-containing protein n=1 Tax=Hypsizygus marmoreus TaxID=39966 RepID=A0A369JP17_HYPMA|nr:hypothetical protein Hypma_010715 [Hypsizygus marmoreus]